MAAVVVSHPAPDRSAARVPGLPHLRVLPGGRAAARRPGRLHPAVYRRRRLAVAAVALILVAVTFLAVTGARTLLGSASAGPVAAASSSTPSVAASAAAPVHSYVVQPGDTLWAIARRLQPSGDVRPLVDRLADRLGGAALEAGQRLPVDGLTD